MQKDGSRQHPRVRWFQPSHPTALISGETILKPFWPGRENGVKRCGATVRSASIEVEFWRSPMTALVQALSRLSGVETETDVFTIVAIFCGVGLFVSLTLATYGLDLSPGFF
jgi:hypothetical protein